MDAVRNLTGTEERSLADAGLPKRLRAAVRARNFDAAASLILGTGAAVLPFIRDIDRVLHGHDPRKRALRERFWASVWAEEQSAETCEALLHAVQEARDSPWLARLAERLAARLDVAPGEASALRWCLVAEALWLGGKVDRAADALLAARRLDPEHPRVHANALVHAAGQRLFLTARHDAGSLADLLRDADRARLANFVETSASM